MEFGFKRKDRVESLIHEEVMNILRTEVTDPRIGFVTVTKVEVTDDLRQAKIFISILGDEQAKENSLSGLKSAAGFIRHQLAPRLGLRLVPEILFKLDETLEHSSRVLTLLHQIDKEKQEHAHEVAVKPRKKTKKKKATAKPKRKKK